MTHTDYIHLNEALSNVRESLDTVKEIKAHILWEMRREKRCGCVREFLEQTPYERMDVTTDFLKFAEESLISVEKYLKGAVKLSKSIVKIP